MGTSIARPIIARAQVEVALATGCDALCLFLKFITQKFHVWIPR
jgi:hypothetical protein